MELVLDEMVKTEGKRRRVSVKLGLAWPDVQ